MIAGAGFTISITAIIYNEKYLELGLLTFIYGLLANLVDKTYWYKHDYPKESKLIFSVHFILMLLWIWISIYLIS